jgi:hypothetical protein
MGKLRRTLFWVVVSSAVLCAGCTEEQLRQVDRAVADANAAAHVPAAVASAANAAAPGIVPPQVQSILELLGFAGVAGVAVWQRIRASGALAKVETLTATGKAIVRGVDNAGRANPEGVEHVKAEILAEMQRKGIEPEARETVRELKAS